MASSCNFAKVPRSVTKIGTSYKTRSLEYWVKPIIMVYTKTHNDKETPSVMCSR